DQEILRRIGTDGQSDAGYGTNGDAALGPAPDSFYVVSDFQVTVYPDGSALAGAYYFATRSRNFRGVRVLADGTVAWSVNLDPLNEVSSTLIPDGRVELTYESYLIVTPLLRLTPTGQPDTTLGPGGRYDTHEVASGLLWALPDGSGKVIIAQPNSV